MKVTQKTEEYIESLYKLEQKNAIVKPSMLADDLNISQASVTEMVKKLSDDGVVKQSREGGIRLTLKGVKSAARVVRRHRLSERLLTDIIGISFEEAHEEACKLEHVISPEVERNLERALSNPRTCPHGNPIPDIYGKTKDVPSDRLSTLKPKQRGIIEKITEEGRDFLKYLATLGLMPQMEVEVEQVAPFDGPLLIKVNGANYAIGREVASKIWVKKVS
ncbi:MAG: metal-dependent transcriptional regulator [Actinobacteria bacterium]|nr:metal-dependent transcriptional regulator [Actinomycetota bacterium]